MTLIELMVVITILALMATAIAVNVVHQFRLAEVERVKTDFATLKQCLDLYRIQKGRYPSTEEGLQAVVAAKLCENHLEDPWHRPYLYSSPGVHYPDGYDLKSYGADGQPGGEEENADVGN
jgi:general secretion pathway protein G